MAARTQRRLVLAGLALLSYGLALFQRPGQTVADTRLELSVDPGLFLDRIGSVWSASTDLGHVQGGQFNGYLFPMGPYFAGGDALGLPMWLLQRLWLGSLLFLAAWGVVRLMEALLERPAGLAHAGAALLFVLNPYVVLYTSRGTVTLLAYAALPWFMLCVQEGLREPRRWRRPALFGLLLAATGGGVNAAVIAFALVGPLALVVYELVTRAVARGDAWSFAWRTALAGALGSAWWVIPLALQSRYGQDFLLFTEQPATIWGTTSMSELVRLLGFWGLYTGVGYGSIEPFMGVAGTYLFSPPVILATFLVPLFAVATFRLTSGWRYAPFFALLAVVSLLLMFAGFPEGTRLRTGLVDLYDHFKPVQFLRTTYKAAPLLALSLACLGGLGAALLAERRPKLPRPALALLVLVPLVAAVPLLTGRAIDRDQAYGHVPGAWRTALRAADRAQPPRTRTMVLPGELFGWYRWGGTMDPVGPALSRRPLAIREIVPYADPRSSQLQIAVDDLVQQGRLVPGQLLPLLRLLDVGAVIVASDSDRVRSGAPDPATVEAALADQQLGGGRPFGARRTYAPPAGRSGAAVTVPDLSLHPLHGDSGPGGVRVLPAGGSTVLEGDAEAVPELAALGMLDSRRALFFAGDLAGSSLRRAVAAGAPLVFSDSARRRVFIAARLRGNRGPTLGPQDPISAESPTFDPFPGRGSRGQTVALYTGLRRLYSPLAPGFSQFPQFRPYAALDGRADTSWLADENVPAKDWYLQLDLSRPKPARTIAIVPQADRHGRTAAVAVSANGGPERRVELHRGVNRIRLDQPRLSSLRIRIAKIVGDEDTRGAGGITELRIPGLHVRERLRLPVALASATRGLDLSRNELAIVLQRTTADFPYRAGADTGEPEAHAALGMVDAEDGLERELDLPASRRFGLAGWASVAPTAPDDAIDRLAGLPRGWRFTSSSRFEGVPGRRASAAFDGDPRTAWVGNLQPGRTAWLAWRAPRPLAVRTLRLRRGPAAYAFPSRVRLLAPGLAPVSARVGRGGAVRLARPLMTRALRIEIASTAPRRAAAARRGLRAVAIGEVVVPGLRPPAPRRRGALRTACGALTASAAGRSATMAVAGSLPELDAGRPLRLRGCGRDSDLRLPRGRTRLSVPAGRVMRADHLALRSPAPRPPAATAPPARVLSVQEGGPPGAPERARIETGGPAWLVLDQSFSRGWRARCGERDLGEPVPISGFANGWPVGRDCRDVRFAFRPQRAATAGYVVSALACLLLAALVLAGALQARLRERARTPLPSPPPDELLRLRPGPAIAVAAAIAVGGGLLFALRMGPILGALALAVLVVGVNVRRLVALAGVCIAALPLIYIAFPATDKGGFSFQYASDQIVAHFVAEVAVSCLAAAGLLAAARLRRAQALTTRITQFQVKSSRSSGTRQMNASRGQ